MLTRTRAVALFIAVAVAVGLGTIMIPRGESAPPRLAGTVLPGSPAPNFSLLDQNGQQVTLAEFHGQPVIVSFMDALCTETCPVVAETFRRALRELGPDGRRVGIVILSTDPEHDSAAAARAFSAKHGMVHRWHYLLGSRAQLAPLWRGYYVYAAPANAPAAVRDSHTSVSYLIDGTGHERVLMGGNPDTASLVGDLRILLNDSSTRLAVSSVPAPQVGHPAPALALPDLNGATTTLTALRGHTVLLNFWATWCTACKSEMPMLARWYAQYHGRGLVILGVDQQESRAAALGFVRRYRLPYPVVTDDSGDVSARYAVSGLPTSLLIDPTGTVRSVTEGTLSASYLRSAVLPLLHGSAHA